jgi:hypothetical protein
MNRLIEGSIANPLPGQDFSFTPSTNDRFKLLTVHATLAVAAGGGGEHFHFYLKNPSGNTMWETAGGENLSASSTSYVSLSAVRGTTPSLTSLNDGVFTGPLPEMWFPGNTKFSSATLNLFATDQWSNIFWTAEIGDEQAHLRLLEEIAAGIANLDVSQ